MVKQRWGMRPQIMHKSKQGWMSWLCFSGWSLYGSCSDNYKISSQLAKSHEWIWLAIWWNEYDIFRDLLSCHLCLITSFTVVHGQHNWCHIWLFKVTRSCYLESTLASRTTVVILRENMRQKTQSVEDANWELPLENMRYAACTPEDIKFLKSRIAGRRPEQPKLQPKNSEMLRVLKC